MNFTFVLILCLGIGCYCTIAQSPPTQNCTHFIARGAFRHIDLNNNVIYAKIIPYGGTLTHLLVPDRSGVMRDIVLGFDDPKQYCENVQHPYFGATIGRVGNRIGSNATFTIRNTTYQVPRNENNYDNLHSGPIGFDRHVFEVVDVNQTSVELCYTSPDGDQGFPGLLGMCVRYTLQGFNVIIHRRVTQVSQDTLYNPTNHAYFNLHGFVNNTQTVLDHVLEMPTCVSFVEVDSHLIPTGVLGNVTTIPQYDFRTPVSLGTRFPSSLLPKGYDTAFISSTATIHSTVSGIKMTVRSSSRDNLQVYTGGYLDGTIPRKKTQGTAQQFYQQFAGITFETQWYPDAINHPEWWGFTSNTILPAGTQDEDMTTLTFSISK